MARYTDKLVATLQDRYENTDQSMLSIAAEFDIGARNLQRLVTKHGWAKRSKRTRDVPRAQRLLEQAEALAAASSTLPPPLPPGSSPEVADGGEQTPTAIERIEQLVLKEIEAQETVRKLFRGKRRVATTSERNARTLSTLTQTLHTLQRLRAGALLEHESLYDDDIPSDIDEFRRDLARRIEAFVASRTDESDARGDSDAAAVDEVR